MGVVLRAENVPRPSFIDHPDIVGSKNFLNLQYRESTISQNALLQLKNSRNFRLIESGLPFAL